MCRERERGIHVCECTYLVQAVILTAQGGGLGDSGRRQWRDRRLLVAVLLSSWLERDGSCENCERERI